MRDLTPRPTEYRGITYRSKCEAMFARWLEHQYCPETQLIQYEPRWASCGEYVPDFLTQSPVMLHHRDNTDIAKFATCIELIEYKPSRPTSTYINDVSQKLLRIADEVIRERLSVPYVMCFLYWGSVYSPDRGRVNFGHTEHVYNEADWIGSHQDDLRHYRFDLMESM